MKLEIPIRFVSIGYLGDYTVYINLTKEEAIARYNQDNPDYTVDGQKLTVNELLIEKDYFYAYDIDQR